MKGDGSVTDGCDRLWEAHSLVFRKSSRRGGAVRPSKAGIVYSSLDPRAEQNPD